MEKLSVDHFQEFKGLKNQNEKINMNKGIL